MNGLYDEIRIALYSVWNRRWLALAVAWGICLAGWLVVALIPNSYESEAKLFFATQEILSDRLVESSGDQRKQMERIEQTLLASSNLEKVVRSTALGDSAATDRELSGAVNKLRENIEIKSEEDNIVEIVTTQSSRGRSDGESAKLARDITQKMIDIFQEANIAGGRDQTGRTLRFLDTQIAERQKALQTAEAKRVAFETDNLGLLPGAGSISQRIESARAELSQIDGQLVSAQSALAALNGQLAGTPSTLSTPIPGGGSSNPAASALAGAQSELASARARGWTDSHPDVIALKSQIASLRTQARSGGGGATTYSTPNPAYSSLQSIRAERSAAVAALQARKNSIESDMRQLAARQTSEPGVAAEMERINQDYGVLKDQYDKLLAERENIRLRGEVESGTDAVQFRVIDPPSAPRVPAAPNRPLLLLAVLLAGIAGGAGTAFALGQLRTSFPTAGKLEKASGLPVIGSISQMLSKPQRQARRKRLRLFYGGTGALAGVFLLLIAVEFIQRGSVA